MSDPWVMKYAPKSIDDMVLSKDLKSMFKSIVQTETLPNLLIAGIQGLGKTTLAKLLPDQLGYYARVLSCSADGSIQMVKTTVQSYCQIMTQPGKLKVVVLDEADQLSQQAQMALRNIIVDYMDTTRFILTCNYLDKIIPALQSRCTPIKLEFSYSDLLQRLVQILGKQKIRFTKDTMREFTKTVVKKSFPDIRAIIQRMQLCSQTGELKVAEAFNEEVDSDALKFIKQNSNPLKIRQWLIQNQHLFSGDYIKLAGELFKSLDDPKKMLVVADGIYKMSMVFDKEIQFTSMMIQLKEMR